MKRICLFAGFNNNGILSDYVLFYLKNLARLSEIHYCSDCELSANDYARLSKICKSVRGSKHGKYDFGSWQKLITELGYDYLSGFDELVLANDSVFGPLGDLAAYFEAAGKEKECDFWGFTCHNHNKRQYLNSFFMVFKKNVFLDPAFKEVFSSVQKEKEYYDIVNKYEVPLTIKLQDKGFVTRTVIPFSAADMRYEWKHYIGKGLPFIKIRNFTDNSNVPRDTVFDFEYFLKKNRIDYPAYLINNYLKDRNIDIHSDLSLEKQRKLYGIYKFKKFKSRFLRIHFCKGEKILKLFGITILDTTVQFKTKIQTLDI